MAATTLYRINVGLAVCERLEAHPGAFRVPSPKIDMFVVQNFLTAQECAGLIDRIDKNCHPPPQLAATAGREHRTSETCYLHRDYPIVQRVDAKLTTLLGIDPLFGEGLEGQRYAPGQELKAHHDYLYTHEAYWKHQKEIGGQRTWTAMAYLNQPDAGGETFFPLLGLTITPRTGNLLTWNNLHRTGKPNWDTLHQGLSVGEGAKYIFTKWYRERPWHRNVPTGTSDRPRFPRPPRRIAAPPFPRPTI